MKRILLLIAVVVALIVGGMFAHRVFQHSNNPSATTVAENNQSATDQPVDEAVDKSDKHQSGEISANPKDGAKMVWVPAGEFTMGTTDEQAAAVLKVLPQAMQDVGHYHLESEKPQHKVYLDGYWMYKYEVTVAQYRKFCKATSRKMPDAPYWGWADNHPMTSVAWQDAADYAMWAGVSLPTEAQWEKAARGTDGKIYPWGNEWDASKCANSVGKMLKGTKPVGSFAAGASPYGCLDMAGNVWEWCSDWFDPNYYVKTPGKNPEGPSESVMFTVPMFGEIPEARVMRGGSWDNGGADYFRCADRNYLAPTLPYNIIGFRCAKK